MARLSRNSIKSNFFHVMVQGINKEYILGKIIKEIRENKDATFEMISLKLGISKTSVSRYIKENTKNNT